jgi:multisubunit Na+/H+ antiporter MnhG subunit
MSIIEQIEQAAQVAAHAATLFAVMCWALIGILLISLPNTNEVAALVATSLITSIAASMIALAAFTVEVLATGYSR